MRNLKKVLSLALALVMLLGMMVVGAGAATSFKDDGDIADSRKVAVAVANKIGVLQGVGDNTFNPNGTLTRAEAAVVLAKLDLGADAAKALTATNAATFNDVGTGYGWAKAYIDYCAGNGYMVGVGGNNFAPGRTLTSVEFATMVCRVLGYKDENEYGKDGWTAVKAAALARKAGLGADVAIANADMSRADMAQMVLNALTAPMVEYTGLNGSIGDATFSSPATVRVHSGDQILKGDTTYTNTPATATTPIRLCEERFPDLKLNKTVDDETFGRTLSVWTWKRVEIAGTEDTVEPDAVFTAATKEADVKKEIGKAESHGCTLFTNGQEDSWANGNDAGDIAKLTGNGRLVEVYLDENYKDTITKIVVVDTALGEVTRVNDSKEEISIKLEDHQVLDSNGAATDTNETVDGAPVLTTKIGYGEIKKGDMVLVQGWYNGDKTASPSTYNEALNSKTTVTSVVEAPQVVGLARSKNYTNKTITVDGEAREMSYGFVKGNGFADFAVSNTYDCTLYLDGYNNIIKAIKGEKTDGVIDKLIAVESVYNTLKDNQIVREVKGVLSNGETTTLVAYDDDLTGVAGKICTYAEYNRTGKYTVVPVSDSTVTVAEHKSANKAGDMVTTGMSLKGSFSFSANDVRYDLESKSARGGYMYADDVKFIFVQNGSVSVVPGRQTQAVTNKVVAQALREVSANRYEISAVFVEDVPNAVDISDIIFVWRGSSQSQQVQDLVVDKADGSRTTIFGYEAYDANGDPIPDFFGAAGSMGHKFIKKDTTTIGEYTVYKNTAPTSILNNTVLQGTVVKQNGTNGDAFILTNGMEFITRGTTVVDLVESGIDNVVDLNRAANTKNVVISVLYNKTSSANLALTVFVERVTDKTNPGDVWGDENTLTLPTVGVDETVPVAGDQTLTVNGDVAGTITAGGTSGHKATVEITGNVTPDEDGNPAVVANGNTKITINVPEGEVVPAGAIEVTGANNEIIINGDANFLAVDLSGATGTGNTLVITGDLVAGARVGRSASALVIPNGWQVTVTGNVTEGVVIDATTDEANTTTTIKINGDIEAGADITADPKTHFEVAGEFNAPIKVKVTSTNKNNATPQGNIRVAGGFRLVQYTADSWSTASGPLTADSYADPSWKPLFIHWGPRDGVTAAVVTIWDENGDPVYQEGGTGGVATINTQPLNTAELYWVKTDVTQLTTGKTYTFTVSKVAGALTNDGTATSAATVNEADIFMSGSFTV